MMMLVAALSMQSGDAFSTHSILSTTTATPSSASSSTALSASLYPPRKGGSRNMKGMKSKRQERVQQLVKTELASILHTGNIKGDYDYLDGELRKRISIVSVDVSPDLRQARISISVRNSGNPEDNPVVDQRRAYSWLVSNTKPIRHTLAQRMSHMKSSPTLTFVQVDVGAAVDVMYLIDKVTKGSFERDSIGEFGGNDDSLPRGYVSGMDFDEEFEDDDEDWEEDDEDFF